MIKEEYENLDMASREEFGYLWCLVKVVSCGVSEETRKERLERAEQVLDTRRSCAVID